MLSEWMIPILVLVFGQTAPAAEQPEPATTMPAEAEAPEVESIELSLSGNEVAVEALDADTLIIRGTEADLQALEDILRILDRGAVPPMVEFFQLKNAQAKDLATKIQAQLREIRRATGRPERPQDFVSIQADPRTNMLMVAASESMMELVRRFIEQLDQATTVADLEVKTFTLKHRPPSELKTQIENVLKRLQEIRGDTGPLPFNIEADDRLNQLRIYVPTAPTPGIQQDIKKITDLISEFDVEPAGLSKVQMVVLQLRKAAAQELAKVFEDMIKSPTGQATIKEQIARLRLLQRTKTGELEPLPELDLEKPIRIIASDAGNALIVGTVEENIPAVTAIVDLLDMVPLTEEMSIRLFPLKYADARATADLLKELFERGKELPKHPSRDQSEKAVPEGVAGKALVYQVGVHADPQTNTVIVSGRIEQVLLAQQLINDIDVPGTAKFPFKIVELKNAGAPRVEAILKELMEQRIESLKAKGLSGSAVENERVFIAAERRSNSLIISAKPDNYEEIAGMIQRLDEAPDRLAEQIRIITLDKTNAADLADRIEELFSKRRGDGEEDAPVIIADPRSNSLVLASSPEDYKAIKSVVEKLEAQEISPLSEFRLVKLKFNDASEVARTMEELFKERAEMRTQKGQDVLPSDKVAIGVDSATNSMIVVCSPENFDVLTKLVAEIDIEIDAEGLVQTFELRNANADDIADRIKNLWEQGIYKPGAVESELQEKRDRIAIVADPRANAVVVSASRPNFSIIERLIRTLDADPTKLMARMRIFRLTYADAIKIADVLKQYFEGVRQQVRDQNVFPEPTIIPDERSNSLIVAGTNDALIRAGEMIERLDVETHNPTAELKVYTLENASGVKLGPMIRDLFEKRQEGTDQAKRTPFQVMADEATNSLIVSASREDHITLADMLIVLDKPSTLEKQMRIFSLSKARAEALAETLTQLFETQARGREGGAETTGIAITPDERTNSLVVWAAPSDLDNIEKIIARLDSTEPKVELMVKIVRLKQSLAEDLAEVLNNALGGRGAGGRRGTTTGTTGAAAGTLGEEDKAILISFLDTDEKGEEFRRTLLRQDLTIVPDLRTNSIIIVAPPDSVEMLESLIRKLDTRPESLDIRVFQLINANAEDMKALLDELFRTEEQAREGEEERRLEFGPEGASFSIGGGLVQGEAGRQQLSFTVDKRTNSLIAAGTEQYLDLVQALIYELDSQDIADRTGLVYQIKHSTAADLSSALDAYFQAESSRYERLGDETAMARQIAREVSVIASEETNSLLLNFDPRRESEVMRMVRQLDRPPPQVMIQVLLAEVSLDDRVELGLEFAVQDLLFSEHQQNGFGSDFDFVLGTDIGAAGSGLGGFSFTITGEDFNFLLRMLQSEGRLVVLSRPMITAQDNKEANIEVADRVPFVRGVTISDTGATQSQVEYQDVGIILNVTPHINPDGFVTLEIHPEISNITPSSITITEGLTAPIFNARTAETTVTVKDGETIVIGGLIQHRDEETENKVPVVGDLPFVGALFRATAKQRRKSELLIVVTPYVVRTVEDARLASEKVRDQHAFPAETLRSELWENLRVMPGEEGIGPAEPQEEIEVAPPAEFAPEPEQFRPLPEVYGPPLPERLQSSRGRTADFKMVGPPLYEDYLKQRH